MDHDGSYHSIYSNPEMMEDLLRYFVGEAWLDDFDFSTLKRVNAKFHHPDSKLATARIKRREGDIIYQIKTRTGTEAYLYLFLEFQSTEDTWMAVRINSYVSLFMEQLIKENQLTQNHLLPPVFTIVLYNGQRPWKAPTQLSTLIDLPKKSTLRPFQPSLQYFLIDETQYKGDQQDSLSGLLFQLERCRNLEQVYPLLTELVNRLREPQHSKLNRDFSAWIKYVLQANKQLQLDLSLVNNLSGVKSMLSENLDTWVKETINQGFIEGEAKGKAEGEAAGKAKGIHQGESALLIKLLEFKFDTISNHYLDLIHHASSTDLGQWSLNILDAQSIEGVFKTNP